MTKVIAFITMSLDGFVAGPDDRVGVGLGEGGERLHEWMFGGESGAGGEPAEPDQAVLDDVFGNAGAWIVGRTMHDLAEGWGDEPGFGVPVFVVTHRPQETAVKGDTTFEFVTDGIEAALARARAAAGEKNVLVMGGADLMRQYWNAGVLEELALAVSPILLGAGKLLFDGSQRTDLQLERLAVVESPRATHLRFRVHM